MRLWLALLCLVIGAEPAWSGCQVVERTRVPITVVQGSLLITVQINGQPATMVLDTGAQRSVLSRGAVQRLGLRLDEWVATTMRGVGGVERHRNALPDSLSLGGIALERRTLTRDTSLTVASLPLEQLGQHRVDGLLGRDFLSVFDLDLDLQAAHVTLYDVRSCDGNFLPWRDPYTAVPTWNPADTALVLLATVDGVALRALLDTGAARSVIAAPGMVRLGLTEEALRADAKQQAAGLGPRTITSHVRRFRRLQVGALVTDQPVLAVAPIRLAPITDMLLGADWLAGRRLWISFATKQVFVAR